MNPLIKWPGGKNREIKNFYKYIPVSYKRYIEPFFGGGALFFYLEPEKACINDKCESLMQFYDLIKSQDQIFYEILMCYSDSFNKIINSCNDHFDELLKTCILSKYKKSIDKEIIDNTNIIINELNTDFYEKLVIDKKDFIKRMQLSVIEKISKIIQDPNFVNNYFKDNIITSFTNGYYMYFRDIFNKLNSNQLDSSIQYKLANFYFIREYCYGSMFRYNSKGEFNIPYGGISYNKKNFKRKIDMMFNDEIKNIFNDVSISCSDFEYFLNNSDLNEDDFIFLDPPYDSEFSDYNNNSFSKSDHKRLVSILESTPAKFMLVIKKTDFIANLYNKDKFNVVYFDKKYTCNIKCRNTQDVKHLIITNY